MTIDLKKLQKDIVAEVNRREYERVSASAQASRIASTLPNDLIHAFEPMELEGHLPPGPERYVPPVADDAVNEAQPASAQVPPPSLYRKLRSTPLIGKYVSHPRIMGFLTRVRERPGGASLKNVVVMLVRAVVYRIPGMQRLVFIGKVLQLMPERMYAMEYHLADGNTRLRNIGLQIQNQTNQSLYTHALAIEQNEQYLFTRMERLEQRQREHMVTVSQAQVSGGRSAEEAPGMPPELYLEFEANFRGSKEMIRERLKANLPYFMNNADAALTTDPVLDLGCGRGEWLQLLKEANIPAIGVDSNTAMIECCTDAGLEAYVGDALQYLAAMPAHSLSGLTAFHIIEHLPLDVFIGLIDEARRVVRPGGVVLFETPNPENLIVGACNFYIDPTHRNPMPPALVGFMLKARGFERVEIDRRHPGNETLHLKGSDEAINAPLNRLLFGAQDYAAIGYAPE
ncbi:methyltransferase domain-containing protein [Pseudomonas sp. CDFA 602]|uniref:class I SAM-dependent methyltransferase n=1 Tax=Pseudomonas californiensis TaxID=2829823 RepID=UPI001E43FD4C|nr:class I SAM-dependent methyltransferase [Pseudomonas californiensis]MCD5995585.1 methyltransferase domain-containing protein [Pseudomonas californiensis]MCD6001179.1 methyltransferase domain-containing protein [Pseudomonas californiensis]